MDSPLGGLTTPYILIENRLDLAAPARLYRDPVAIIRCETPLEVDDALSRIETGLDQGLHAAGLFSYELAYVLEPRLARAMPDRSETPLLWLGLFEPPTLIDAERLDASFADLAPPPPISGLHPGHDRETHVAKVRRILDLIAAGDIYQANLTFPLHFRFKGDPLALYAALRSRQPVGHGGMAALGDLDVVSVSPELWIEVAGDQAIVRPMKGTAPRGANPSADSAAAFALAACPKQRAENLMIVDLLRNDLARISVPGTVAAPALFTVETYPSLHTLTSTVTAELRVGVGLRERLTALFPCGSIVGAPKVRAGEIIRELEAEPRGFYTGALGWIGPNRDMSFNVAIRTAVISKDGRARYGIGGGIVADSNPDGEYDEALLKGRVLTALSDDYSLIETFRWSTSEGFVRLALHLDRLERSAKHLGFAVDRGAIEGKLSDLALRWRKHDHDRRVRLLLRRDGRLEVTDSDVPEKPQGALRVGISDYRVDAGDPFLRHKTTSRSVYDSEFERAIGRGLDEALFLNRRGQVAEASRNTVFAEIDGHLVTPPLSCGLLPGVLRQKLIAEAKAVERVLVPADLHAASALFLGNSLHGLRTMILVGDDAVTRPPSRSQ